MLAPHTVREIDLELARRHLADFFKLIWPALEPGTPLIWGWHLDAICDHLEAVHRGEIRDLICNVPPRSLKSSIVSIAFPAWEWLQRPELRYITASYSLDLATRDAVKTRRVFASEAYQQLNRDEQGRPIFALTGDQNIKSWYENDRTGHRICTSPGSALTGHGGNRLIIDDAHNIKEVPSLVQLQEVRNWWNLTMSTRRNDIKKDARIAIGQRSHSEDLYAYCIGKPKVYSVICFPLEFEAGHETPTRSPLNFVDPRTREGELLMPERISEAELPAIKEDLGPFGYAAIMQQRPSKASGNILHIDRIGRWRDLPDLNKCRIITSWDLKFGGSRSGQESAQKNLGKSFVVGGKFAQLGKKIYLIDLVRAKWDFVASLEQFRDMKTRLPYPQTNIVENQANGKAMEAVLQNQGIELVSPTGSKEQRAHAVAPFIHSGDFLIPDDAEACPWVHELLREMKEFPLYATDDQVDMVTQGLIYLGAGGGVEAALASMDAMIAGLGGMAY